jgi:hypothetical protein
MQIAQMYGVSKMTPAEIEKSFRWHMPVPLRSNVVYGGLGQEAREKLSILKKGNCRDLFLQDVYDEVWRGIELSEWVNKDLPLACHDLLSPRAMDILSLKTFQVTFDEHVRRTFPGEEKKARKAYVSSQFMAHTIELQLKCYIQPNRAIGKLLCEELNIHVAGMENDRGRTAKPVFKWDDTFHEALHKYEEMELYLNFFSFDAVRRR